MAKKTSPVLLAAGLLLAVHFIKQFASNFTNRLKYGSIGIRFKGITTGFGLLLEVVMPITNENSASVTIDRFIGSIYYGQTEIAKFNQLLPVTLTGGGQTTNYILEAAINLEQLSADIKQQITNKNFLQAFVLKGRMQVGSFNIPINEQITVLF